MLKSRKFAVSWLLLILSLSINAADEPLRFYSEVSAPYYFLDKQGNPQGINVDVAKALTEELQIDNKVEEMPWARALQETLNKPNRILLSTLRTQSRESQFQWLGRIHRVTASLVSPVTSQTTQLHSLEDAKQHRIGTIRGYGSAHFLQSNGFVENVNLVLVSDIARLWQMLNEGRIDMVVSSMATDKYEIADIGLNPNNFHAILELPELDLDLYVATGPKTDKATVAQISTALENIKQQGKLQAILNKWGVQ